MKAWMAMVMVVLAVATMQWSGNALGAVAEYRVTAQTAELVRDLRTISDDLDEISRHFDQMIAALQQ